MIVRSDTPERARWEVLWIKDRRVVRKDCGTDLPEAMRIYLLVEKAGRKGTTLRCKNMQFPPPDKYADREVVVVRRGRKRVKAKRMIKPKRYQVRMLAMNRKGIWWCGYCMKMRRFVKRKGFRIEGVWVDQEHLACPMCGASHKLVSQYNPLARQLEFRNSKRVKDPNRKRRRQRRRETEEE